MAYDFSLASARARIARLGDKKDEMKTALYSTVETGATAFGFGWLQGRYESMRKVAGVDTALLTGIALNGLGYFLLSSEDAESHKYAAHAINVGNGALSVFLAGYGAQWGTEMLVKSKQTAKPAGYAAAGALPAAFHVPAADLQAVAQRRNWR